MTFPCSKIAAPQRLRRTAAPLALAAQLAVAGLVATAAPAATAQAAEAPARYDIPAGPLNAAIHHFVAQSGRFVAADGALTVGRHSPGLQGRHGPAEALARLLAGTGLQAVAQPDGSYALRMAPPAAPEAPRPQAATVARETVLPAVPVTAKAEPERATGPVQGYVARRSATATKTDTPILETPQSIAVVGAEQISDQKATSLTDALAYTPGVVLDPGYANSYDVFYSRGFRLQDGSGGVYRDGLKLGGSGWATGQQEPYGLERVELLKGAASVLFGAAAPGGVLNVVTKQPQLGGQVNEVVAEAGNHGHRAVAADVGVALSDDLAARIVLLARDAETTVDHIPNDTRYVAPSLRWTPSAATSLTLLGHVTERRTAYIWGVPAEGSLLPSPYGRLPRERFVGEPDFDRQDTRQASLGWLLTHRFSDGISLRHGLRWIDSENHVRFTNLNAGATSDPRDYQRRAIDEVETTRGVSADTSVQADLALGGVPHKAVAGFDVSSHRIGSVWQLASLGPLDLFDPIYGATPGTFAPLFADHDKQRRVGLYLQDQIKLGTLTALAGIRRDDVRSELNGETEQSAATTGRLGVVWEVVPGLAPFASWSQSFEPVSGIGGDGERYQPTRGDQLELGVRWQRGDLTVSAAAFDLVQKNVLKDREDLERPVQTGEVRSRGLELEAKGPIARHVQLIASYAYTDAKVTESETAAEIGQPVSYQPRHQAALWTRVDHWLTRGLHAGFGVRYTGRTADWGGSGAPVPAYTTFDAMAGYATGPWTLRLNVNNLTDETTFLCSGGWCTYGDGLRATASVAYRW